MYKLAGQLEIYLHINKTKCIMVNTKVTAALAGGLAARARARRSLRFGALCERGDRRARARGWLTRQWGRACSPHRACRARALRRAISLNLLVGRLVGRLTTTIN